MEFSQELKDQLSEAYEQMIWLAGRPGVTPGNARAWYSHVIAAKFKNKVRRFTGKVSQEAIKNPMADLCLEHYFRIQTSLTQLLNKHIKGKIHNPEAFIQLIYDMERVHLVLEHENQKIHKCKGHYPSAGVILTDWEDIDSEVRALLYRKIKSSVLNAKDFAIKK
jgi:hypothetical protein